jgi:transcriptional regulator of met regulon
MNNSESEITLQLRSRITEKVSISIPIDTLESLTKIATIRDMSVEDLLKFYIGQGLRADLTKAFSERVLDPTAQVLARHIDSEEEILTILREIQAETGR